MPRFVDADDTIRNNEQFRNMLREVSTRPDSQLYNELEDMIRGNPIHFIFYVIAQDNRRTPKQILRSHKSITEYVAKTVGELNPSYGKYIPGKTDYDSEFLSESLSDMINYISLLSKF